MPTQATSGGHGAGFSPRPDGQLGDGIRVDGAQDALRDGAQLALLRLREWNEDEAADLRDMRGCAGDDLGPAVLGEEGERVAAVGRIGRPAHPAALLQSADDVGQPG